MRRASTLALALLAFAPLAFAEPESPARTAKGTFVSNEDNGMGTTLIVETDDEKLSFLLPPDGSGAGLEKLQKGDALEVSWRDDVERRVFRAQRGGCPKKKRKGVFCVQGSLKQVQNGDLGKYFILSRGEKEESWLADFEPKGNVREKKDVGRKVALFYKEEPIKRFTSFKALAPDAKPAPAPAEEKDE